MDSLCIVGDASKKILRGSKKILGGDHKNIKSIKTKILHIQNRREPGQGGENLCAMGDQKKNITRDPRRRPTE